MILEMVHQVFLAMLAQEIELNLLRRWGPLEVVECLRRLDLDPTRPGVQDSLHNIRVIAQEHDILVQLCRLLLIKRE